MHRCADCALGKEEMDHQLHISILPRDEFDTGEKRGQGGDEGGGMKEREWGIGGDVLGYRQTLYDLWMKRVIRSYK